MTELLGLPYSPWSEKARWALDVRHVPYKSVTYAPLLGELGLRRRTAKWSGPVSVPVLFVDGGRAIADSAEIARWADTCGDGPVLFPTDLEADVVRYVALSEKALDAGRCLALHRVLRDDAAAWDGGARTCRAPCRGIRRQANASQVRGRTRRRGYP